MTETTSRHPWEFVSRAKPGAFSIAPEHDFLACIAKAFYNPDDPIAVAKSVIMVPNRRSARTLKDALVNTAQNHRRPAVVLPAIIPLENAGQLATLAPEHSGTQTLMDEQRRGILARMIRHWHQHTSRHQNDLAPSVALAWAQDAATLLDQGELAGGCNFAELDHLTDEADLAAHWQDAAKFLHLVLAQTWPKYLDDTGYQTKAAERRRAIISLIEQWKYQPPDTPVWIVGSTGTALVDRILMRSVIDLPLGAVVFRGVDTDASQSDWEHICISPSHPQHAIKRTLDHLRIAPANLLRWPTATDESPSARARRRLIYQTLAPAAATRDWTSRLNALARQEGHNDSEQFIRHACYGLNLIEASDDTQQAMIAALALRRTAQDPNRSAALVTPDNKLARRVSCLLRRWGINITPSQGHRFLETDHGRLITATVDTARDAANPVALLCLLKQPLTRLGRSDRDLNAAITQLELARDGANHLIRGPRRHDNLNTLAQQLDKCGTANACALVRDVATALDPLASILSTEHIQPENAVQALTECLHTITSGPADDHNPDAFVEALNALARIADGYGQIPARQFSDLVMASLSSMRTSNTEEHPRLAIWGSLEARLLHRDFLILAGLNEKTWPRQAPVDGLLPSRLRTKLGLPDTEEILGLSAYDFSQLACGSDVLLLRSASSGQTRTVASRWIWRLSKLCQAGMDTNSVSQMLTPAPAQNLILWAEKLRLPNQHPTPVSKPQPRPPLCARPRSISASTIRFLLTDPYVIYARDILKLRPLPLPGSTIDPRLRGCAIHTALETCHNNLPLIETVETELIKAGMTADEWVALKPLWERAANEFLSWDKDRQTLIKRTYREIKGKTDFGPITLTARADRIEELADGSIAIIDFKTGEPPQTKEVESGDQPQLPVTALIAMLGGFDELNRHDTSQPEVSELIYYRFGTGRSNANNGTPLKLDTREAIETIETRLRQRLNDFDDPNTPYTPRTEDGKYPSDYDRLSRRSEWAHT